MKFVSKVKRTHYCGQISKEHVGQKVVVMGWVDSRRDHGGLVFLDLRDREGIVQIVLNPNVDTMKTSKDIRGEFVVAVSGVVRARPEGMQNKKIRTGEIEIEGSECEILNQAAPLPFQMDDQNVHEMTRLKYRYLDLRSERLQKHIRLRHEVMQLLRSELTKEGFYEIETPILYKSTPEGARDYLVPSRVNQGRFYALPQSPQTLKQLLMIAGYDKYFQIARCFRDEDLRADRQPEFTQLDLEMSYIDEEDIISVNERLVQKVWKTFKGQDVGAIPRMTFDEAMNRYGIDKPDVRFGLELQDLNEIAANCGFKVFTDAVATGGSVKGFAAPGQATLSRAQLDKLTDMAKRHGGKGLVWIKCTEQGEWTSPASKFVTQDTLEKLFTKCGGKKGDIALIVADSFDTTCAVLAQLRLHFGRELNLIDTSKDRFLWVVDFPLFEYSPEEKRWMARHHPFTSPKNEDMQYLIDNDQSKFATLKAKAYDLVCNGYEMGGGSIRIFRQEVQAAMFKSLGISPEDAKERFGFFLEALQYGTPPHGGIAWGMDRLCLLLAQTEAIREVIAFPKTAKASCMMSEAPSRVDRNQLMELGIRLAPSAEKALTEESANV